MCAFYGALVQTGTDCLPPYMDASGDNVSADWGKHPVYNYIIVICTCGKIQVRRV